MPYLEEHTRDGLHARLVTYLYGHQARRDAEWKRYEDYADGHPDLVQPYFKRRHREGPERFFERPKQAWPLCGPLTDMHAEALAGQVQVTVDDERTQEAWSAFEEHNDTAAQWVNIARVGSIYGAAMTRPLLYDDGTPEKALEFEYYTPRVARPVYTQNSGGASVRRWQGMTIRTGYSTENAEVLPWPVADAVKDERQVQERLEFISPQWWVVWLDGVVTPRSPVDGAIWMPTLEGVNPFGANMFTVHNGLEDHRDHLGMSDIRHAVHTVQWINEIWSDVVYMHRMYVPIGKLRSVDPDLRKAYKSGIGVGMAMAPDEDFDYAYADVDFTRATEPMRVALELFYSTGKAPAAAVGLGHLFGGQNRVSAVAKEFEWKPTIGLAEDKEKAFKRDVKAFVRMALQVMATPAPYGQGLRGIRPDAEITVDMPHDIVPTSKAETIQRLAQEILAGMKSKFTAIMEYNKWKPQRAALEADLIAAEHKARLTGLGMGDLVALVQKQARVQATSDEIDKAIEVLKGAGGPLASDEAAQAEEDAQRGRVAGVGAPKAPEEATEAAGVGA